jgi:hypothetical protein
VTLSLRGGCSFLDLNDPFELLGLNSHVRLIRRAAKSHKKDQDSNFGLLCFSKNWNDPLLWSHYGEKHRGLCLGFDLRESKVEAVKYEDRRIRTELDLGQGDALRIPTYLQRLPRVTKARCWNYEQEVRVFIPLIEAKLEGKLHFWPFNDDLRLVEVIIGPESNESVVALERAAGPEVYVSKARLAWRSFTVVLGERTFHQDSAKVWNRGKLASVRRIIAPAFPRRGDLRSCRNCNSWL